MQQSTSLRDVPEWTSGPFLGKWQRPIIAGQLLNVPTGI